MPRITLLALLAVACAVAAACSGGNTTPPTVTPTPTTGVAPSVRFDYLGSCDGRRPVLSITPTHGALTTAAAVARTVCAGRPFAAPSTPASKHIVAISAGHGGPRNIGAVHHDAAGNVDLVEKDLNLDIARRLDALLRADGYATVLIRDCDCSIAPDGGAQTTAQIRAESQARADAANAARADVLVVIHHDGSTDPAEGGTSVYYDPDRSFGVQSRRLAQDIHDALIASIDLYPYADRDRGVLSDASIGAHYGEPHAFLFGEAPGFRPTTMPAALGEALFVTNDAEAALLRTDRMRQLIAEGYRNAIEAYFAGD